MDETCRKKISSRFAIDLDAGQRSGFQRFLVRTVFAAVGAAPGRTPWFAHLAADPVNLPVAFAVQFRSGMVLPLLRTKV
jgi:hypothetical protein